jgi:hypothetical protein
MLFAQRDQGVQALRGAGRERDLAALNLGEGEDQGVDFGKFGVLLRIPAGDVAYQPALRRWGGEAAATKKAAGEEEGDDAHSSIFAGGRPPANGGGYTGIGRPHTAARNRISHIQSLLLWGLLFSSIGLGFFIYGRRQRAVVPLICGVCLMIFPYFVARVPLMVGIGAVLMVIPYFLRR